MPRSKRDVKVSLTVTKKKTAGWKKEGVLTVRNLVDRHSAVYVFAFEGPNARMKELRDQLTGTSRFYQGSRKRLAIALGKDAATEYKENLSQLSEAVAHSSGLFFTNLEHSQVQEALADSGVTLVARWRSEDHQVERLDAS